MPLNLVIAVFRNVDNQEMIVILQIEHTEHTEHTRTQTEHRLKHDAYRQIN
jgi:hypothetical protein